MRRMQGYNTLWLPGTDHAGIATQNVVERELAKEGKTRHDLGREEFVKRVWQWRETYGGKILDQLRRLGASCDWSRERFTLDEGLSRAVTKVFVMLYNEGLIYRDYRLINWCPRCETALSDLEVDHKETNGNLWYIRYPLTDDSGAIIVATTRPETMLGDTAVAVNPDDDRYRALIGKLVRLPLTESRDSDHRRFRCRSILRHRRSEDHACPRLQRLRDGPPPQSPANPSNRYSRQNVC